MGISDLDHRGFYRHGYLRIDIARRHMDRGILSSDQ
ncbi:hypothetical protein CPL00259L_CDS0065 [Escherichia phage McMelon]